MIILMFIHVIITLAMIGVILLQRSEGGGLGMGASPSSSMFSARGTANLLTRVTAVLFALFVGNALLMGILSKRQVNASILKVDGPVQTPVQSPVQPEGTQIPVEPTPVQPSASPSEVVPQAPEKEKTTEALEKKSTSKKAS